MILGAGGGITNATKLRPSKKDSLFFKKRYYKAYVCNNGVIQFNYQWKMFYPYKIGARWWMEKVAMVAPYWSRSDATSLYSMLPHEPTKHTSIYYQAYQYGDGKALTDTILTRATNDAHKFVNIKNGDWQNKVPSTFKAKWAMVVTWVNMPPDIGCRYYYWWYCSYWGWGSYYRWCLERQSWCLEQLSKIPLNHFQAVLITDGVYSFTRFIYPQEGLNWGYPAINYWQYRYRYRYYHHGYPVGGYCAGDGQSTYYTYYDRTGVRATYENIPKYSGTDRMESLDTDYGSTGEVGIHMFRLENSDGGRSSALQCFLWNFLEKAYISSKEADSMPPCPCNLWQTFWDTRFAWNWRSWWITWPEGYCANLRSWVSTGKHLWKTKCCYDNGFWSWGTLRHGSPRGGAAVLRTPVISYPQKLTDQEAYRKCCIESTNMCYKFYEVRPSPSCKGYVPPRRRRFWGDPHLVTLDGLNYTFNGLGEFVLADFNESYIQVQARAIKAPGGLSSATVFSATVMQLENELPIQINLVNGTEENITLYINGIEEDLSDYSNETTTHNLLFNSTILSRPSDNSFQVSYDSGVTVYAKAEKGMLSIQLTVQEVYKNQSKGLMGIFNDDTSDDFTAYDGTVVPTSSSEIEIYTDFGLTWRVLNTSSASSGPFQSKFHYLSNESYDSFIDSSFQPTFRDNFTFANATLEAEARAVCGNDSLCLYDISQTGRVDIGQLTKEEGAEAIKANSELDNFPPTVVGLPEINVTLGTPLELTVNISDQNEDDMTVEISSNSTSILTMVSNVNGVITLKVLVDTVQALTDILVLVKDSKDASAIYNPYVFLHACQNGEYNILSSDEMSKLVNKYVVLECTCSAGYTGTYCESDLDACAESTEPCYPGVRCLDQPAPANISGYDCGPCPSGYTGDGKQCDDIVECGTSDNCQQVCVNAPGSFICSCLGGYSLQADDISCSDINECIPASDCHHVCTNTIGSYNCSCNPDFTLQSDKKACLPSEICNEDTDLGCDSVNGWCYMRTVSANKREPTCGCKVGYSIAADGTTCEDKDECATGANRCNQMCHNLVGTYNCSCYDGFTINSNDLVTCTDVDECFTGDYNCSESEECDNVDSGYNCTCSYGLTRVQGICIELNDEMKPAEEQSRIASDTEKYNAISLTANMMKSEYTVTVDVNVAKAVANAANMYCNSSSCPLITTDTDTLNTTARRRRSTSSPTFTFLNVMRINGYPVELTNDSIQLAYYLLNTESSSLQILSGASLSLIMTQYKENIEIALGNKSIDSIDIYAVPTTPATNTTTTGPGVLEEDTHWIIYVSVSSALAFIIIVSLIVFFCIRAHNSKTLRIDSEISIQKDQTDDEKDEWNIKATDAEPSKPRRKPNIQGQGPTLYARHENVPTAWGSTKVKSKPDRPRYRPTLQDDWW